MDDLRATLDAHPDTRRRLNLGRAGSETGAKFPTKADQHMTTFRPPPSKEEVQQRLIKDNGNMSFGRHGSGEFRAEGRLMPKVLGQWSQQRLVQPDRTYKKAPSGPKFKTTVEEFPNAHDGLCTELHQSWLEEHRERRHRELYPEVHALQRIDAAKAALDDIKKKRAIARDVISRDHISSPKLSANEKAFVGKVKGVVRASRLLNMAAGIDRLEQHEQRCQEELERAMSSDALRSRPKTPEHRPKHPSVWAGAGHKSRCLAESTPWREKDDDREMSRQRQCMRRTF